MRKFRHRLTRHQLLAAEIYGYSYANYEDHLGIGNIRYEELMPQDAELLERAALRSWPLARTARELETSIARAEHLLQAYREAAAVVDAENPAESFRNGVRFAIRHALARGIHSDEDLEKLVTQICYRAADLAYLLELRGEALSRYSRHLRRDPAVEYSEGYFDLDHSNDSASEDPPTQPGG